MHYGILSGALWALDTTVLSIALAMSPFSDGTAAAVAFAAIVSSAFHDILCALWMTIYSAIRGQLGKALAAIKTRDGLVVAAGALLGGPIGMSGYVMAINLIGPSYTAVISAFYPAFGTLLAAIVLKEKVTVPRMIALAAALLGIVGMSAGALGSDAMTNPVLGIACALLCVVGWGSEAVFCAWGMKGDNVDDETALQIRETTSGLVYALIVLPVFGAWGFAAQAAPTMATGTVALSALAGVASYLFYYKAISKIGAARGMALNISYSAWAVILGIALGNVPGPLEIGCCVLILAGTVLAACNWKELFGKPAGH